MQSWVPVLLQGHLEGVGEERCAFVSPMVFANRAMATRANLEREAQNWLDEAGTPPPGNGGVRILPHGCHCTALSRAAFPSTLPVQRPDIVRSRK